jgi:uncharacterized protein (TIGR03000 family)
LLSLAPPAFAQRTFNGRIDAGTNPGGFRPGVYGNVYQGNQIDFRSGYYGGPGAYGYGYYGGYQPNSYPVPIQVDAQQYQRRVAESAQRAVPQLPSYTPSSPGPTGPVAPDAGTSAAPGPAPAAAGPAPSRPASATARITVRLPADAELWFGDVRTQKTGPERAFTTPAVESDGYYGYTVTARWVRDGRVITRQRLVRFQAGGDVVADLDRPDDVTKPSAPNSPSLGSPRQ